MHRVLSAIRFACVFTILHFIEKPIRRDAEKAAACAAGPR
jgi:hypothetical protein